MIKGSRMDFVIKLKGEFHGPTKRTELCWLC